MGCIGTYKVLRDWPLGPFKGSHAIMHGLRQFELVYGLYVGYIIPGK